jgi:tetratricopeptide (TPR) repeat protein
MGLGRPADAAEAYKAALGMDAYAGRGKALANLGIAYVQMGQYVEAVKAFERATQLHGHQLSSVAQQSYDAALDAAKPSRPTVEGWETGDLVTVQDVVLTGDGWATGELACLSGAVAGASEIAANVSADAAADTIGIGDEKAVEEFFSLTEDEMRQRAKSERRAARKTAGPEGLIRRIAVMLVLIASLSGLGAWAYLQGYGWPTQQSTVMGMLDDYRRGLDVGRYWVAVTDKDLAREMAKVPPEVKEFTVDAVDGRATVSTVSVTVTPVKGAPLHYRITLRREGVGWKVDGVENDWRSTEQSRAPKRTPEDPIREREDT